MSLRAGFASWLPGRCRAPPGSTTRPRQELADDRKVYFKRRLSPLSTAKSSRREEPQQDKGRRRDTYGESGAGSG